MWEPERLRYAELMAARAVQVSMDAELLDLIDTNPEVRERGRSAFIRSAVRLYLQAKQRREVNARLATAYAGQADAMLAEIEPLIGRQSWPSE